MKKIIFIFNIFLLSLSVSLRANIQETIVQAVDKQDKNLLRTTIDRINSPENYNFAFGAAIEIEDLDTIKKLLEENKVDPNAFIIPLRGEGILPLMLAVKQDQKIVQVLLSYGANPFLQDKDGINAVMLVSSPEMLKLFAPKAKDKNQLTLIFAKAVQLGADDLAEALFKKGINIHYKDSMRQTLLHYADRNPTWLRELIKKGVGINSKNKHGETPLMSALGSENIETIRILLEAGANPNLKYPRRDLPILHYEILKAMFSGNLEVLDLLLEYGANIHLKNKDGQDALTFANDRLQDNIDTLNHMKNEKEEFNQADLERQQKRINNLKKVISLLQSKDSKIKVKKSFANESC